MPSLGVFPQSGCVLYSTIIATFTSPAAPLSQFAIPHMFSWVLQPFREMAPPLTRRSASACCCLPRGIHRSVSLALISVCRPRRGGTDSTRARRRGRSRGHAHRRRVRAIGTHARLADAPRTPTLALARETHVAHDAGDGRPGRASEWRDGRPRVGCLRDGTGVGGVRGVRGDGGGRGQTVGVAAWLGGGAEGDEAGACVVELGRLAGV